MLGYVSDHARLGLTALNASMAARSSWTAPAAAGGICTRAISPATRGSSMARWMAATVCRSDSGLLPPESTRPNGSRWTDSGGTSSRSSSRMQSLGTPR
ncbi:Uncharacterised protein [Mycobacteroides abscessus subsp. abscessus]|nr:Uncharacterised protein [Mycobacteroides abscessus subsp. abscessus]